MRMLFLILLLANLVGFAYIRYAENSAGAAAQIALLQINPEKVKLLTPRGKDKAAAALPSSPPQPALVCLEWGRFAAEDAPRAAAALARFELADKLAQRELSDGGWWVYLPPFKTKAEADRKASEVKALGVDDLYVVQDNNQWRFAISLGVFKTEDAANNHLAQLSKKGVRPLAAGPRGAMSSTFVIRDPGDAIAAKIAGLTADFPDTQLKATACADALGTKSR